MKSLKKGRIRVRQWGSHVVAGISYPMGMKIVADEYRLSPELVYEVVSDFHDRQGFLAEAELLRRRLWGEEEPCGATEEHAPHNSRSAGVCFGQGPSREIPEGGIDPQSTTYPDGSHRPCSVRYAEHPEWWTTAWCKRPVGHPLDVFGGPGHSQTLYDVDKT